MNPAETGNPVSVSSSQNFSNAEEGIMMKVGTVGGTVNLDDVLPMKADSLFLAA